MSILGTWSAVSVSENGRESTPKATRVKFRFAPDGLIISETNEQGKLEHEGEYKYSLDTLKSPRNINIVSTMLPKKKDGKVQEALATKFVGIYELKGDELRISFRVGVVREEKSITRPKNFDGGQGITVLVLKRAAK